eukprot:symbB.v1.2.023753.t1/scaffold2198.1/size86077/3
MNSSIGTLGRIARSGVDRETSAGCGSASSKASTKSARTLHWSEWPGSEGGDGDVDEEGTSERPATFHYSLNRLAALLKVEVPADTEDASGSEDSSGTFDGDTSTSDSSSDRDEEAAEDIPDSRMLMDLVTPELRPRLLEINDDYRMWRHRESGAQHLQLHDEKKFLCGRLVTDKYRLSPDKPSFECPGCKVCFSNKDLENTSTAFWKQDEPKIHSHSKLKTNLTSRLLEMAAYAESGASFRHRLSEIGFTEGQINAFTVQQLSSFNAFAFAICGQPGHIDDARFNNLLDTLFPAGRILGLEANMRQLGYESKTIAVAANRQRVEPADEGQLKRLPPQERDERMRRQAARITGFSIQGELEPGHTVVDFFTTILEECTIRYLPLSRCISREQEISSLKVDKKIVVLESQQLHVKQKPIEMSVDLSNELKVQNAFIRRGLAAEQAGLLTYTVHEKDRAEKKKKKKPKPAKKETNDKFVKVPQSWARPMNLGNLSFVNQKRVEQANFLYEWTCRMVIKLHHRKVHWSVENPAGSLMWATDPFVALQKAVRDMVAFSFHTCMFKSERKKDTALWTSVRALKTFLERKCDEQHQHLPWGVTDAGGCETLASTWAQAIADVASSENIIMEPSTMYDTSDLHISQTKQLNKAFLGALPRGRRVPPVMSDLLALDSCVLLIKYAIIGLPREPWVFVREALNLTRPTLQCMRLQGCVARAVESQKDPVGLRKSRIVFMKKLIEMKNRYKDSEKELHDRMDPHLQCVLGTKNILLFKALLQDMQYPDDKLADEMSAGFPLYGWLPGSGVFPGHVKPPELHPSALDKMAASFSKRAAASVKSSGDADHDLALWEATMSEVREGFVTL